jgi:hypothetical protein
MGGGCVYDTRLGKDRSVTARLGPLVNDGLSGGLDKRPGRGSNSIQISAMISRIRLEDVV